MRARAGVILESLRDSLWLMPALLTLGAIALAAITVEVDRRLLANQRADFYLAFGGGAEGARGVLTAIGSTVITVTGVIFSVTIVALQLASSQFTPLVLRRFVGDRANQLVLGVFIATFTYTLLVLRVVRSVAQDAQAFVPSISVATAIGLALLSIGLLIFFIHHVARSIQASVIIDRATRDTLDVLDRVLPATNDEGDRELGSGDLRGPPLSIVSERAGYVQAIDEGALFDLACRASATIRMDQRIGAYLLPGTTLVSIWPCDPIPEDTTDTVQQAFALGPERTLSDDLELGVRQVTDIALRALSPSLNDPTTAMICFDRLAEIVARVGSRPTPRIVRRSDGACLISRRQTFEDVAETAFGLTRRAVAADPIVARHVAVMLGRIGTTVQSRYRPQLAAQVVALLATVESTTSLGYDLEPVREASRASLAILTA
jgi:uncharacterized membrane protein